MQESFWCSTSVQFYGNSNRIRKPSKVASGNRCVTDWLSAMKNHGVVSMKIASLPGFQERNTKELVMYQFREAVASLSLAFLHEEGTMPPAWIADIAYRITECLDNAYEYILSFDKEDVYATFSQRYSDLHSLITVSEKQQLSVSIVNTMVAEEVLKAVVIAEERGQLQQCCSLIAEAERPIIESRRALKEAVPTDYALYPHMAEQLDDLEHSRLVYLARAESTRCRHVADEMRTLLLLHSSDSKVDSELLWQCVDMYRASMIAASKQFEGVVSHECEAKAAASLGGLFDKVLKLYQTSRVLYLHAVHLADVVTHIDGSVFFHTQWYQLAKRGIDEDNARNDAYDSVKVAEEREPTLLKLRPHLEAIDKAVKAFNGRDYSAHSLLVHLHSAHRPKRVNEPVVFYGAALDRDNSEAVKKALLRAVGYYHPDRGYNKSAGIEWFILCGEITKTLNEAYTRYKV